MATQKLPPEEPTDIPALTSLEEEVDEEVILSSSSEGKPKTGRELYEALLANGFIGAWKDRTDIGDSTKYARTLRENAGKRRRARLRKYVRD